MKHGTPGGPAGKTAAEPHFWEETEFTDEEAVRRARRINRTWFTKGELAAHTEQYLDYLGAARPEDMVASCREAILAARAESKQMRDPKPLFYGTIFSRATKAERDEFLRDHFFTRLLSAEIQAARMHPGGASGPPAR